MTMMHTSTASTILAHVKHTLSEESVSSVTVVGHSRGGAIALLDGLYLSLQLPNVTVNVTTYGMPRVGDLDFMSFVNIDSRLSGHVWHVNNMRDPIPILPFKRFGFSQLSTEIHIQDTGEWDVCPGAFPSSRAWVWLD